MSVKQQTGEIMRSLTRILIMAEFLEIEKQGMHCQCTDILTQKRQNAYIMEAGDSCHCIRIYEVQLSRTRLKTQSGAEPNAS